MAKEAGGLIEIVARIIDMRRDQPSISPSSVATEAMLVLEAAWMQNPSEYPLVYIGCHLELRQLARKILRERFEPEEDADKVTHPLFPELQWRYPIDPPKTEEPQYVLLELLRKQDWRFNVNRLRGDAKRRLRHADKLEAWGMRHFAEEPVS
jgi:hypothetical protein